MKTKSSPINIIWLFMVVAATVTASYTGKMEAVTQASFSSAKSAVTLAIGLVGAMALWLGIMKVVEAAGALKMIARAIRPLMTRLFPDVPSDHPAMSAMIMNMAANALGLGNAATPMGIKAMKELENINSEKGTASDAMCLFLAINTSSVTLLPLGVITVRAAAGAMNPSSILLTSIFATAVSTATAIAASKFVTRKKRPAATVDNSTPQNPPEDENEIQKEDFELIKPGVTGRIVMGALVLAFMGGIVYNIIINGAPDVTDPSFFTSLSTWLIPILISSLLLFGYFRGVKIYETLTDGAKEGFNIAVRIIPYMVAIFVAIGMFRASGALELMTSILTPITSLLGMPAEALPMALIRPLSGSGAFGVMSEIVNNNPDSFLSFLVSTMQGSTETTFYVLAVYFGAAGIKRMRHAIPVALLADTAGILASLFICSLVW